MKKPVPRRSRAKLRSTGDASKVAGKRKAATTARRDRLGSTGDSTKVVR